MIIASPRRTPVAQEVRPAEQLRPCVAGYTDFDMTGWPPGRHRGLPGGTLTLVVSLGTPPVVRRADHADLRAVATVGGLLAGPVDIVHDGTQRGIQIDLTPRGARTLLGMPAVALAQGIWPLEEVLGRRAHELTERLAGAPGPAERAQVLDVVLAGWSAECSYPQAVDAAWRRLVGNRGGLRLLRPGPPDQRLAVAGGLHAGSVDGRGTPLSPRPGPGAQLKLGP